MSSKTKDIRNLFEYDNTIISIIEEKIAKNITPKCGDKIEHIIDGKIYFSCYNCNVVISQDDLDHIIKNKEISPENQPLCAEFLETHGIFRCEDHKNELFNWTFQCLLLHESKDSETYVDYI